MLKSDKKHIKPLPYPVYFWSVAVLAAAGLVDSVYLSISHYRVYTDIGYESFCAISRAINCDTVSQSSTSIFLGMPVPVWGIWAYTFFGLLMGFGWRNDPSQKRIWAMMQMTAGGFSLYSILLALISTFYVHSYCIMCIFSYAINLLLLYFTWLVRRRFEPIALGRALKEDMAFFRQHAKSTLAVFVPLVLVGVGVWLFFPAYWSFTPAVISDRMPTGVTEDGHPWIGAEHPEIVIIEFADYLCFQCNKMHYYLRNLMRSNPGKVRLVHRHFPMDHAVNPLVKQPVHIGSGLLAMVAIYAGTRGKFWQMSDLLFSTARTVERINVDYFTRTVGLDAAELSRIARNPDLNAALRKDIMEGIRAGVTGTPTFVIDGKLYSGQIPPDIISRITGN